MAIDFSMVGLNTWEWTHGDPEKIKKEPPQPPEEHKGQATTIHFQWTVTAELGPFDCDTGKAILAQVQQNQKNPPSYNVWQDCHWYWRWLLGLAIEGGRCGS